MLRWATLRNTASTGRLIRAWASPLCTMSSNTTAYHSLFDKQAAAYSKFRPTYTPALYDTILSFARLKQHGTCLDVATGQGQAAVHLATVFDKVIAIDANDSQLQFAAERSNVAYRAADAHDTGVDEGTIDLVTVGQAMHWYATCTGAHTTGTRNTTVPRPVALRPSARIMHGGPP
jgi:ubiquinone/menaquinone biosynthesis C-methylase UbiE